MWISSLFQKYSSRLLILSSVLTFVLAMGHFLLAKATSVGFPTIMVLSYSILFFVGVTSPIFVYHETRKLIPVTKSILDISSNTATKWTTENMLNDVFNSKKMVLTGLILPFIFIPGGISWFIFDNSPLSIRIYILLAGCLIAFFCSTSLFLAPRVLGWLSKLHSLPLKPVFIFQRTRSIQVFGITFAKFAFIVSLAYSLMLIIWLSWPSQLKTSTYVYATIGIVVAIIAYVIPQWQIHLLLSKVKSKILMELSDDLQRKLAKLNKNLSVANIEKFQKVVELHSSVEKISEWSFSLQSASGLIGSLILPIGISIIQRLIP